jgi:hypothetical protein
MSDQGKKDPFVVDDDWLTRVRSMPVETYYDPEACDPSVCSSPPHRMGATPVTNELARRQRLAEDRENDPTLQDVWNGETTQPDIDSHDFPIVDDDETEENYEQKLRREDPAMAAMWDDVFARCTDGSGDHPIEDCPCDDCNDVALFI